MKNLLQAAGLMATLLFFTTGCELPTDDAPGSDEKIVYIGKLIQYAKNMTYSGYFPIAGDPANKNGPHIFSVEINFDYNRIQFFGKKDETNQCYYSRVLTASESDELLTRLKALAFCELQGNDPVACPLSFVPGDVFYVDNYSRRISVDQQSTFCTPGYAELCESKDFKNIADFIRPLSAAALGNCK